MGPTLSPATERDSEREAPGDLSVNQCRLEIVLADQRLGNLDRGRGGHRLAVGGEDADRMLAVRQVDRLHIGDLLGAEAQKGFFGEGSEKISLLVFHGYLLGSVSASPSPGVSAARGDVDRIV